MTALNTNAGAHAGVTPTQAAMAMLDQCRDLVGAIDDELYAKPCPVMMGSTIGKHLRHTVDHFAALLACRDEATPIDYDHRERDVPMETDRKAALEAIDGVRKGLASLDPSGDSRSVTIRVMLTGDGAETDLRSTLAREIAFATHHAIHHNAMIQAIADHAGVKTPAGFGMAPSTVNHESSTNG